MANPSPKRSKPKLEPISLAELEADSTMTGFTSVFRIPLTEEALPHVASALAKEEKSVQEKAGKAAPTVGVDAGPTVGAETVRQDPQPTVGAESTPSVGSGSPLSAESQLFFRSPEGKFYPGHRVRALQRAEQILTVIERRVYDRLAELAAPDRQIRIGYDRLADSCLLNEKSVRLLLVRLQEKGFLQVAAPADPDRRLGKLYQLRTFEEAKEFHRRQGWQWVVRSGNGVLVVEPVPG